VLDIIIGQIMMLGMPRIAPPITLTEAQSQQLQRTCRAATSSQAQVVRARIVLLAAQGWPNDEIAHELGTNKMTVCKWRGRFAHSGMAGLEDGARSGRPGVLTPEQLQRVLTEVTQPPRARSRWSCRSMAQHAGISKSRVQQLWEQNDLKPHQSRTFRLSNDPDFAAKFWDIVGLYLNPPNKAVVLCCDEKSQCQALERTQPGLPLGQGHVCTRTHDYYRHGTLTLFAALDYLEGKIVAQSAPRHRHQEWLGFLKQIDQGVPAGLEIHLIVDNYATHKHPRVKRWLRRHPRLHPHFTPTSSSWLNLVERFFRDLSQEVIASGSFRSVPELKRAIFNYLAARNEAPRRYVWRADGAKILAKIQRARQALAQRNQ
jgi:transposase